MRSVKGEPVDIDPECVSHDDYLSEFKSMLITKLRNAIDVDIANDPDCIKGRKKTVQVSEFKCNFSYNQFSCNDNSFNVPNDTIQMIGAARYNFR